MKVRTPRTAIGTIFFLNGTVVGTWAPFVPALAERFALSEAVLGLLVLLFGLGALAAMPLTGFLVARQGSRRTLLIFACAQAGGLLLLALAANVFLLAGALVMFGLLIGATDVAMNANAAAVERRLARPIMSSVHGFWSLGGFAGAAGGGFLVGAAGMATSAALVGALVIAGMALVAPALARDEPEPAAKGAARLSWPRQPLTYLLGLLALFAMVPEGAVLDWSALYLTEVFEAGAAASGLAFAAFSAAMASMRFVGDRFRRRFGAARTLQLCAVLAAGGLFGAGMAPSAPVAILFFALAGLGLSNIVPIAFAAAASAPGTRPGIGLSVATSMGYSGILLAPSLIGLAAGRTGFSVIFVALAGLLAAVAALARTVRHLDAGPFRSAAK